MASMTMIAAIVMGGSISAGLFDIARSLATLLVNIAGLGLTGRLVGVIAVGTVLPEAWRGFIAIGLPGELTTFSSFSLDAGQLWWEQGMVMAGAFVTASVLLSLLAFDAGFWAVR